MNILHKWFKVYPGEGSKILSFAIFAAMLQAGLAIGISCADALFLINIGADKLPFIYIATPVIMLIYIPVFAFLMNRFGIDRLLYMTMALLAGGGVALYILLAPGIVTPHPAFYYVAKLYTALWYIALYTLLWNFVDGYFHILDAKRLFSFMSGGMAFGSMVGGGIVVLLTRFVRVEHLFLAWSALVFAAFPVAFRLQARWKKISEDAAVTDSEKPSFREQAKGLVATLRESSYAGFMIMAFLATLMITTLCEFQYMQVFEQNMTELQVASLFGKLYAGVNAFNIIVNLFLFNRLVAFIGVRNMTLIQPVVYAVTFSYFLLDYGFGAAVAGFFAYQGILTSIEYNNQNFLFNALPPRDKAQVRTFIEGLCEPLATASAGIFLIVFAKRVSAQALSTIGLAGAAIALCATLGLRSTYLLSMIGSLKKTWLDFSSLHKKRLSKLDSGELAVLEREAGSADPDRAVSAIRLYRLNDSDRALEFLLKFFERCSSDVSPDAEDLFDEMLSTGSGAVHRRVLQWLRGRCMRVSGRLPEICARHGLLSKEEIRALSEGGDIAGRTAAAVARWMSWQPDDGLLSMQVVRDFISGTDDERVAALQIVEASGRAGYVHFLVHFLSDRSPLVREQAMKSISRLAGPSAGRLVPVLIEAVSGENSNIRSAGFDALEAIADPACIRPLVKLSPGLAPSDRRRVEAIIMKTGLRGVPVLTFLLKDPDIPYTEKMLAVKTLGVLSPPQMNAIADGLISDAIMVSYKYLHAYWTVSQNTVSLPALEFLARVYRDIHSAVLDFVLVTLTVAGRLPEFEMLATSLRSRNPKERANAIETIEQGCTRKVFHNLIPLLDARPVSDTVMFYMRTFNRDHGGLGDILLDSCRSRIPLEQMAALQAAWRLNGQVDKVDRDSLKIMMKDLLESGGRMVSCVILGLLEEAGSGQAPVHAQLNPVEIAYCLTMAGFFKGIRITHLERVIESASVVSHTGGRLYSAGDDAGEVYILLDGTVDLRDGGGVVKAVKCLQLAGDEVLKGLRTRCHNAVSAKATLLSIPGASIIEAAQTHPDIAVQMLAYKLGMEITERPE